MNLWVRQTNRIFLPLPIISSPNLPQILYSLVISLDVHQELGALVEELRAESS